MSEVIHAESYRGADMTRFLHKGDETGWGGYPTDTSRGHNTTWCSLGRDDLLTLTTHTLH